jgi:hypothetical protein
MGCGDERWAWRVGMGLHVCNNRERLDDNEHVGIGDCHDL